MRRPSRSAPRAASRSEEGHRRRSPDRSAKSRRSARSPPLDFPDVTIARLSNGVELQYAQRTAVPVTQLALSFDAGDAADAPDGRGLQSMVMTMLDEGTTSLTSQQIAEAQERLGADIETGSSLDRSTVTLSALSANLAPSLDLLGDIVKNPAFDPAELERVRDAAADRHRAAAEGPERHRPARAARRCCSARTIPMRRWLAAMRRRSAASPATIWSASSRPGCGPTG